MRLGRYGGICQYVRPEIEEWLERLRLEGKSPRTRQQYGRIVRGLAAWLQEKRGRELLTAAPDDLVAWRAGMRTKTNTILACVAAMRSFYRWAVVAGRLPIDPSADVPTPPRRRGRPRPIPEDRLVLAILNAPERIRPWLFLAALAGLRAREIADLQRDDLLDSATPPVMIVRGKGGRERVVPLSTQLLAALIEAGLPHTGHLFLRVDQTGPNTPHRISCLTNAYLHSIGIPETLHQLRHRFATQAYAFGHDLRQVQELLGHASPTTTAVYADYASREAAATVAAVQIDLHPKPNLVQFTRDPSAVQVSRPPDVPVRPRSQQSETPVVLRRTQLPVGRFELAVKNPGADDHQVRKPRTVPARIVVVKPCQTLAGYFTADQPQEGSLVHLVLLVPRSTRVRGAAPAT